MRRVVYAVSGSEDGLVGVAGGVGAAFRMAAMYLTGARTTRILRTAASGALVQMADVRRMLDRFEDVDLVAKSESVEGYGFGVTYARIMPCQLNVMGGELY